MSLLKARLANEGYDPVYGARPLRRLVQSAIGDQLARELLGAFDDPGESPVRDVDDVLLAGLATEGESDCRAGDVDVLLTQGREPV